MNVPLATGRTAEATAYRLTLWALLYAIPVVAAVRVVTDLDIWWHLRVGEWVVQDGTVPATDPFSSWGRDRPWVAYSWLFEVLVFGLHQAFGLTGIVGYRLVLSVAIVAATHALVARREPRFLPAMILTGLVALADLQALNERPWLVTILFTTWTLDAILALRAGTASRAIWLLPLAYVVWANVHIQFIYGLFLLGLGCAAPFLDRVWSRWQTGVWTSAGPTPDWPRLVGLTAACAAATLLNPYHVRTWGVVAEYAMYPAPFRLVTELKAPEFRDWGDWIGLALGGAAAFALGRRGRLSLFEVLLLAAAAFLGMRARRDLWFLALAAAAILAQGERGAAAESERFRLTPLRGLILAAATLGIALGTAWMRNLNENHLREEVAKLFPERAAQHVKEKQLPGPLFNHFDWGGYLIWRLPELPVAIDGRTNLHGDERIERFEGVWMGKPGWERDPDLSQAGVVIAHVRTPLASLLRTDPRFELVFEEKDGSAVVFAARHRK